MTRFLKICSIFIISLCATFASAQNVQNGTVTVEDNFNSIATVFVQTSTTAYVKFRYYSNADTTVTDSVSVEAALNFQSVEINLDPTIAVCDSVWNGWFEVFNGGDTLYVPVNSWSFPCPGEVSLGVIQVTELEDPFGSIQITIPFDMGNALGTIYFQNQMDQYFFDVFGSGTLIDTIDVGVGNSYSISNFQAWNIGGSADFLFEAFEGTIEPLEPQTIQASLLAVLENSDGEIGAELQIENSGFSESSFLVFFEKMLCDGSFEVYDEELFEFTELVTDSVISMNWDNLPQAPAWRLTLEANNGTELFQEVIVDFALNENPSVGIGLDDLGFGEYEALVTYSQEAGNELLEFYIDGVFVDQVDPDESPYVYVLPELVSSYSATTVEVVLTSNACSISQSAIVTEVCGMPTHVLELPASVTSSMALIQLAGVNFNGCVEDADVGIMYTNEVTQVTDTSWYQFFVDPDNPANYMISVQGLDSGTLYTYKGLLYSEGEYFETSFSLNFTTLEDEGLDGPHFSDFYVDWNDDNLNNWDIVIFVWTDTGDSTNLGLRIIHDSPTSPPNIILDVPATVYTSLDWNVGEWGTHVVYCELYDVGTGTVLAVTDPSWYTLQFIWVEEFGKPVEDFDVVQVFDIQGRLVAEFQKGTVLSREQFADGIYLIRGIQQGKVVSSSKISLEQ